MGENECFACHLILPSNEDLMIHVETIHGGLSSFKCIGLCARMFSRLKIYKQHRRREHSDSAPSTMINNSDSPCPDINSVLPQDSCVNNLDNLVSSPMVDDDCYVNNINPTSVLVNDPYDDDIDFSSLRPITIPSKMNEDAFTFKECLKNDILYNLSKLYNYTDVSRKRVQDFIDVQTNYLQGAASKKLQTLILNRLSDLGDSSANIEMIKDQLEKFTNPFESLNLNSEYKHEQFFENNSTFILPEKYIIGERLDYRRDKDTVPRLQPVQCDGQIVPLRKSLKKFLEIPTVFNETMTYLNYLNNESQIISNFVQGDFWKGVKNLQSDDSAIMFPLFIYFDDFETNNPLGSHRGVSKLGAVYASIPCLPINFQSKLENIFLFLLFNTLDRKSHGNLAVFNKAIDEIKFLEEHGIVVNHDSVTTKVHFKMSLILGDNLGIHQLFGLVESFNGNYPCRFCLIEKTSINDVYKESDCVLRTEENYTKQLAMNSPSETGIVENCVFHEINNFHITRNIACDPMHDLLEGVAKYDLALLFLYFIRNKKYFTLEHFNDILNGFHYSTHDKRNTPPSITENHLNQKYLSCMSASEMLCLIRNLSLMIGDFIPEDDPGWSLFISLKEIVDIVFSTNYHHDTFAKLETHISEYLQSVVNLFSNVMKPKHHYLVHYPRIMKLMGPLSKLSSFRYESKHKEGKTTAKVSVSRKNVARTLAFKHQLKFNYRLLSMEKYSWLYSGPVNEMILNDLPDFKLLSSLLPVDFRCEKVACPKYIAFLSSIIRLGSVLMLPKDVIEFYLVKHIFLSDSNLGLVIVAELIETFYHPHYDSYEIIDYTKEFSVFRFNDLFHCRISHKVKLRNSNEYILKRWS